MATVRFSEELKGRIKRNAQAIYDKKMEKLKEDFVSSSNFGEEL